MASCSAGVVKLKVEAEDWRAEEVFLTRPVWRRASSSSEMGILIYFDVCGLIICLVLFDVVAFVEGSVVWTFFGLAGYCWMN